MLKRVVTILMIFCIAFSFAKDFKAMNAKVISRSENRAVIEKDGLLHHIHAVKKANTALSKIGNTAVMDTILRFVPPREAGYYGEVFADAQNLGAVGGLKDTVIKRFNLLAPGYIKKVMMQNKHEGTAELQFWGPCFFRTEDSRYVNLPENAYESSDGTVQIPGAQPFLPFSATVSCVAHEPEEQFNELGEWVPEWNVFDMDVLYPGLNPLLTGDSLELWVGYVTDGVSGPTILQDVEKIQENVVWWWDMYSFSTLKAYGPDPASYYAVHATSDPAGGPYNPSNHILQIVVEYTAVPPFIENTTILSNMYATEAVVKADVFDLDSETFTAQIQYKIGSAGEKQYIDMVATGNGDEYTGTISAAVGDTVFYVIKASDGELENLDSQSYHEYIIKEKPAGKDILVIRQGDTKNDSLYHDILGDLKTVYWVMNDENGLHESVVNAGWQRVFVTGFGTTVVPVLDEEDPYGFRTYLDNGGNLVLGDPDWAYANPLTTAEAEITCQAGDFAYDYFGIASIENDPNDGSASTAEENLVGVAGHAITGDFSGGSTFGPLIYAILDKTNWGDFAEPNADGVTIFSGASEGKSSAVMKKNETFSAIYFGFWPEVVASEQVNEFQTLVNNILAATTAIDNNEEKVALEFALEQNYPNPFNPTTRIEYSIPNQTLVSLKIYDIHGNLIRTLENNRAKSEGRYVATWDARNDFGARVATGVYFCKLQTENNVQTLKMLLMK
ncbi:MAG: T9SS type A sorting domain-containing protein [Candidatus Marinimicrobia bacterium]|nr:T9SS type A sorting domain-containing protein [Candidatus Neomarinimicrobiota bacterium]